MVKPNREPDNGLTGKEWLKHSISIWSIAKSKADKSFQHPATFPEELVTRLLQCHLYGRDKVVLDPFMGIGTTLVAACNEGHYAVGFELYREFAEVAEGRLSTFTERYEIHNQDARTIGDALEHESVDMLITSPPYWNILNRKRTADYKQNQNYGESIYDIGNTPSYEQFIESFIEIMREAQLTLKPNAYCIINVMDIRIKDKLYVLHSDLCRKLGRIGLELDDIIIWDRRADYNNLRPLGYPYKFRLNRVHEYLLIFQKKLKTKTI